MKHILLVLLFSGWIAPASGASALPTFLVGEWVVPSRTDSDHQAKKKNTGGIYLLADGRAGWTGGEVGLTGTATYDPTTRVVTLVTSEDGGPTYTFSLAYAPNGETLTVAKVRSTDKSDVPNVTSKTLFIRRSTKIPADVFNGSGKPKA